MEMVKSNLVDFNWTIDCLINPVKQKLYEALNLSQDLEQTSTTFLTSQFYKPSKIESELSQAKCRPLQIITAESQESDYLGRQVKFLFNTASLVSIEALSKNTQDWIEELLEFCYKNAKFRSLPDFLEYAVMLENVSFHGASHPHFLSSLFLKIGHEDTKFDFLVSIIHEAAHQELFLINFIDRLVNAEFDHNLIHAPYQNRVRPPIGRIHSLHALFRMNQFGAIFAPNNPKREFLISKYKENLNSFGDGELTDFGTYLLRDVYEAFSKIL